MRYSREMIQGCRWGKNRIRTTGIENTGDTLPIGIQKREIFGIEAFCEDWFAEGQLDGRIRCNSGGIVLGSEQKQPWLDAVHIIFILESHSGGGIQHLPV